MKINIIRKWANEWIERENKIREESDKFKFLKFLFIKKIQRNKIKIKIKLN